MDRSGASGARRDGQWWCRTTLRGLAVAFVVVGANFLFFPNATVGSLNAVGGWLGDFPPLPESDLRFWLSLTTGYMVLVTALAYLAQRDLRAGRQLVALLALGKATTSLTSLAFYAWSLPAFAYLLNFLVDGSITLAALAIWLAIPRLRPSAAGGGAGGTGAGGDDPGAAGRAPAGTSPSAFGTAGAAGVAVGRAAAEGLEASAGAEPAALGALLEAMIPQGGPFPEGARDVRLLADVDSFVGGAGTAGAKALRLAAGFLDLAPLLLPPWRGRRFRRLTLEERIDLLEAWEVSRLPLLRQAVHNLKMLITVSFYSRPQIEARLGYPAPLARVPRSEPAA